MSDAPVDLPDSLGVMLLPGTALFPGSMLPLYIFEPGYRTMLALALESERMFAIASTGEDEEAPQEIGGAGIVRACVANDNGTSNLILQGICRVKFDGWDGDSPFPKAAIQPLTSHISSLAEAEALRKEVFSMVHALAKSADSIPDHFLDILGSASNCEIFTDLAAASIVGNTPVQLRLMEELDVTKRLEILAAYLTHLLAAKN